MSSSETPMCRSLLSSQRTVKSHREASEDTDLSTEYTFSLYSSHTGQATFLNYCCKTCEVFQILHFPQAASYYDKITDRQVNSNSYLLLPSIKCHKTQNVVFFKEFSCQNYDLKWHLPSSLWETGSLDFPLKYKSQTFIWILSRKREDATDWEETICKRHISGKGLVSKIDKELAVTKTNNPIFTNRQRSEQTPHQRRYTKSKQHMKRRSASHH